MNYYAMNYLYSVPGYMFLINSLFETSHWMQKVYSDWHLDFEYVCWYPKALFELSDVKGHEIDQGFDHSSWEYVMDKLIYMRRKTIQNRNFLKQVNHTNPNYSEDHFPPKSSVIVNWTCCSSFTAEVDSICQQSLRKLHHFVVTSLAFMYNLM